MTEIDNGGFLKVIFGEREVVSVYYFKLGFCRYLDLVGR